MKRWLNTALALVLMLAIAAGGFFLPNFVSARLDRRNQDAAFSLSTGDEQSPATVLRLKLTDGMQNLFYGAEEPVELDESAAVHTLAEMAQYAQDLLGALEKDSALFGSDELPEQAISWMSHSDYISEAPEGFTVTAHTENCPVAAMENPEKKLYAVQFHPEVNHTQYGLTMLDSFLKKNNTIGIEGIDTRHLTRIIRESGVMNGAILTTFDPADPANKAETEKLLETIRAYAVTDAVKSVTCEKPEVFNEKGETHIVLMHYGCKRNIVRCLVKRGCKVTVMPAFATAEEVAALNPDGIMLSNGPGDPAEPVEVIENLKQIFALGIPTFGICLGHQLSALAAGAKTMKLKYGHRGANQPVTDFESGRTFITSQNHGYAVVGEELPAEMGEVAQVNANDGTCEGIKYKKWNCFTVQFHPEANGGPKDTEFLFDRFLNNVKAAKKEVR